jgi:hypothetical protein
MEHGGRLKAIMDEDAEEWPEGRPDAPVFSLIQEVEMLGMWKAVCNGRRQRRLPQPPKPLDRAQIRRTTALTKCLKLDVCAQIDERNVGAPAAAAVARAAATAAVAPAIGARCISYTSPRLVQILSDFEEGLLKYNWLSSQYSPGSSPVGDPEGPWDLGGPRTERGAFGSEALLT